MQSSGSASDENLVGGLKEVVDARNPDPCACSEIYMYIRVSPTYGISCEPSLVANIKVEQSDVMHACRVNTQSSRVIQRRMCISRHPKRLW